MNQFGIYETPKYTIGQILKCRGRLVKIMGYRAWNPPIVLYIIEMANGDYDEMQHIYYPESDLCLPNVQKPMMEKVADGR